MRTVIRNGKIVNVLTREILPWSVVIEQGVITCIGREVKKDSRTIEVDAKGQFLVPGLISAHDHYEMTLMSAVPFAEAVLPWGTTAAVFDPHDIVNVMGMEGMRLLIEESRLTPLKAFFMVPPCVPSVPNLEKAGCEIRLEDIQRGLQMPNVLGVAEVMSFNRVLSSNDEEMQRILKWAGGNNLLIDGHCPEVRGEDLCRYIASGPIRTDHESTSVEEQVEKLRKGMYVILRRGSIKEPMSAGELVKKIGDTSNLLLAVDGCISPEDILEYGHMNWAVQQIISEGVDPLVAIQMATINPARCYRLDNRIGLIAPGRSADIIFVGKLEEFNITQVMVGGKIIENHPSFPRYPYPPCALKTLRLRSVSTHDLVIKAPISSGKVCVRIIEVSEGELITKEIVEEITISNGIAEVDPETDRLKVAVFERYGGGTHSLAFVRGFGLKKGALAGSIGQDSQNIVAVGVTDSDIAKAINRILEIQGGIVVVEGGKIIGELSLPIGGIMTNISPVELAEKRQEIKKALWMLGCKLKDPIFTLSLSITLVVIPSLKLSNNGLVDVKSGELVNNFII